MGCSVKGTYRASTQNNRLRVSRLGAFIYHFHSLLFVLQFLNRTTKNHSGSPKQPFPYPISGQGKHFCYTGEPIALVGGRDCGWAVTECT